MFRRDGKGSFWEHFYDRQYRADISKDEREFKSIWWEVPSI